MEKETSSNRVFVMRDNLNLSFIHINPGDWVVLKPNLVKQSKETDPDDWQCVITSPEIIRAVCENVCYKLHGQGRITICDAPQTDSSFQQIVQRLKLFDLAKDCSERFGIPVSIIDLRNEEWRNEGGIIVARNKLNGDPEGSIAFNLGKDSLFYGHQGSRRYYGADYESRVVNSHHHENIQEYLLCATPIKSDVFINLAKLKTHKKTGVTLSLKNLVGINADKNWLPHHTEGTPSDGGDQFPDRSLKYKIEHIAVKLARSIALNIPYIGTNVAKRLRRAGTAAFGDGREVIRSGNWYGNDTTWRMVLDLNRCLLYGNHDGTFRTSPKRYYSLIDGIIGMEGMGPMQGDAVDSRVIIGGSDPVAVDMVASRIMGFDWRKIPVIREAFHISNLPITQVSPENVEVVSDISEWNGLFRDIEDNDFLHFTPHFGWAGHIEYSKQHG